MGLWIARCMPVQLHFFIQSVRKKISFLVGLSAGYFLHTIVIWL